MALEVQQQTAGADEFPNVSIVSPSRTPWGMLHEAWAARRLLPWLGSRVLVKSYANTKLGRAWLVLRPAIELFGMSLLFGGLLGTPSHGVPYFLFLLAGMIGWRLFDRVLYWATRSFDRYRRFARSLHFPLILIPFAAGAWAIVEFVIYGAFFLGTVVFFLIKDGTNYLQDVPHLLLALLGLLLLLLLAEAIGLWLSVWNARARDVRFTLRYLLQVWLYVTPVIYPVSSLHGGFKLLGVLNPVAAPIEMVKSGLIGVDHVKTGALAVCLGFLAVVGIGGLFFFNSKSPALAGAVAVGGDDGDDDDDGF